MELQLREFCAARAGDKGNASDVGIFACDDAFYAVLREQVTSARVKDFLAPLGPSRVDRYEVPGLRALKFVIHDALGGGAAASLRADNLGKTMGGTLLRMTVDVTDELAASAPRPRPPDAGLARDR
jgi:hypothetical protein